MLDLKILLLLNLLSFSLQDKYCLETYEFCAEKGANSESENESKSKIDHCYYEYNEKCTNCEDGYAVSSDGQKCISFKNCLKLAEGDQKCSECQYRFLLNSNGQCERSTCSEMEGGVCISCQPGYYLKEKQCYKITLPYCQKLSDSNENECEECLKILSSSNGKCVAPEKIIKGCAKYDTKGKCTECADDYTFKNGNCDFNSCSDRETKIEMCGICEAGFDLDDAGLCIGYDGTKDTSTGMGIKIKYALLALVILSFI
jgi:hypothetical protein